MQRLKTNDPVLQAGGNGSGPQVGEPAPEFYFAKSPFGRCSVREMAMRVGTLVLISQDSYQFHPN